jgi:hypothetical protein
MLWTTLTSADLEDVMTSNEQALAAVSTSVGRPNRIPGILANLIAEIRGMVATWAPNTLSADTTKIPPSFKARALVLARGRVLTGIPDYVQDDDRKKETEEAEAFFRLVAKGTIRPEPADDAVATAVPAEKPSGVEIVSCPGSRTGRERMDGI